MWAECSQRERERERERERGFPLSYSGHIHSEVPINELPVSIPLFGNTQAI